MFPILFFLYLPFSHYLQRKQHKAQDSELQSSPIQQFPSNQTKCRAPILKTQNPRAPKQNPSLTKQHALKLKPNHKKYLRTWNRHRGSNAVESCTIWRMRGLRVPISTSRTLKRNPRRASRRELLPSDWPPRATISGMGSFSPKATAADCRRL